jgi:hypothetical protein
MGGADVVPDKVLTGAFGLATLNINPDSGAITYELEAFNLPTGLSGAHIHVGAPGVGGPVLFDLRPTLVRQAGDLNLSGSLGQSDLTTHADLGIRDLPDALQSIIGLTTYIDVHTDGHPDGEIRGLLVIAIGESAAAGVKGALGHRPPRTFR